MKIQQLWPAVSNLLQGASHLQERACQWPARVGKGEIKMRLVDNLRKAEEKSVKAVRRGAERVRDEWSDVERRIRQRMRIYPPKKQAMAAGAASSNLEQELPESTQTDEERKPIVSIHGQDLDKP
jgi:hypothetical protein